MLMSKYAFSTHRMKRVNNNTFHRLSGYVLSKATVHTHAYTCTSIVAGWKDDERLIERPKKLGYFPKHQYKHVCLRDYVCKE